LSETLTIYMSSVSLINRIVSCAYRLSIFFLDICWLRLDFETFQTLGPAVSVETTGGLCQDTFVVTVNKIY